VLTVNVLEDGAADADVDALVERWMERQAPLLERWQQMLAELRASSGNDSAIFTVAMRELFDLAQAGA
jgi:glutamate dehydrogenase